MEIELSIIIVNYNGMKYFQNCFDSIYDKLKAFSFEIIVLDNNSKDNSVSFIKENYPNIILIASKINYGFGKGNNEAIKFAKGKYILLLNNDTILLDDITPALQLFKSDCSIGAIGINMLNAKKEYLHAVGKFPNIFNLFWMKLAFNFNKDFKTGVFTKDLYEVDWITGSFILMPIAVFKEIEGFDEDYFLYVEDVDLCKKIAIKGYKRVFYSKLNYIHFVGFNTSKNNLLINGFRTFITKHYSGFYKKLCYSSLYINSIVKKIKNDY
jgi:GT2 family glycosyltransferase